MTRTTVSAATFQKTSAFMRDLKVLCEKYGLAIVPTFEHEVSFHDSMRVVPLDEPSRNFMQDAGVDPDQFPKEI